MKLLNKFNIRWCTNVFSIKIKNIIMIILNLILYFFQLYNIYYDCLIYWTFSPSISTYDFTNHSRSKLNLSDYLKRVIKCGCDYFHHLIDFSKLLHFLLALFLFIKNSYFNFETAGRCAMVWLPKYHNKLLSIIKIYYHIKFYALKIQANFHALLYIKFIVLNKLRNYEIHIFKNIIGCISIVVKALNWVLKNNSK